MKEQKIALIGYTGFVGSNLSYQHRFDTLFNSSNIGNIGKHHYDLIVCAAPSAVKWKANKEPAADMAIIRKLMDDLSRVDVDRFIQISTIDIYGNPVGVDEGTPIETDNLHAYGKHRFLLEEFVREQFEDHLIVRLPALFGEGLKKNFIYDLLNNNCIELQDSGSEFQYYNLGRLWKDLQTAMSHDLRLLNITSTPINSQEVARECFGTNFDNHTGKIPARYDVRSRYDKLYGGSDGYLYNKKTVIAELKNFVETHRVS